MKKLFIILGCFACVILIFSVFINFYVTHKTRYLNYNAERHAGQRISYLEYAKATEYAGLPDITVITDKQMIKKIFDYLNHIPLVYVSKYESLPKKDKSGGLLSFYNEDGIVIDWISFLDEKYLQRGYDTQYLKAQDKDASIVSDLEVLILN